jgi:hypothetical protein
LAYPYGDFDARVVMRTASVDYRTAATLPSRQDSREALEWPRTGVYHGDGDMRFALKVSPSVARLRRSTAWGALDSLRRCAHAMLPR